MELLLLLAIDVMCFRQKPLLLLLFLLESTELEAKIGGGVLGVHQLLACASVVRAADVGGARLSVWRHIVVIVYQPTMKLTVGAVLRDGPLLTAALHFGISY